MKNKKFYKKLNSWMDQNVIIMSLRQGLIKTIPIILIGSLALVIISFPIPNYQEFIHNIFGGNVFSVLEWVYLITLNILCIYLAITVSYCYALEVDKEHRTTYSVCAVLCNILLLGSEENQSILKMFSVTNLCIVLLVTIISSILLKQIFKLYGRKSNKNHQEGTDVVFKSALCTIIPIMSVFIVFIVIRIVLNKFIVGGEIQQLGTKVGIWLFSKVGNGFVGASLFVFLIHFLWFFGIHGSNLLLDVAEGIFEVGIVINQNLIAVGKAPTEIFTKSFFDCFVLMGGSGATICLVFAILIASKRMNNRKLLTFSAIPSLFNINELLLFGIPVIFNPIMMIPFIITPMVLLLTSTLAIYLHLVPVVTETVNWTTPVIFSGILATKSWTGGVLQIINIIIGIYIYIPFIKISEKQQISMLKININTLNNQIIEAEERGTSLSHFETSSHIRDTAKMLIADLHHAVENNKIELFYQPQVYTDDKLIGAEALLRWNHPVVGYIYPPLVIALAKEDGYLDKLGFYIIEEASKGVEQIAAIIDVPLKISVNISPLQLNNPNFCNQVEAILKKYDFGKCRMAFEITEQIALEATPVVIARINKLREMGIMIIMDDFGMGHSSMVYLQNNEFDCVKLDGSLVRSMLNNKKSENIIDSIQHLTKNLGCTLIAEYVESEEQRIRLEELGCNIFQGYLYGKAVHLKEFKAVVTMKGIHNEEE